MSDTPPSDTPPAGSEPPAGLDVEDVLAGVREDVARAIFHADTIAEQADRAIAILAAALAPWVAQQRAEVLREAWESGEALADEWRDTWGHLQHVTGMDAHVSTYRFCEDDLRNLIARADRIAPTTERTGE